VLGLLVAAIWLIPGAKMPDAVGCLGAVVLTVFMLQGLAVAHGVFAGMPKPRRWLVGTYVLLMLFMQQTVMVLVTVGLLDVWMDFRTRHRRKSGG
jgi:hypothetical protein